MSKKELEIQWLDKPEEHDYPAAEDYLLLVCDSAEVGHIIPLLKKSKVIDKKAKDLFRTSCLPILGTDNYHVKKNLKKIEDGEKLSPILIVVDTKNRRLIIADGYHRLCAIYCLSEDLPIRCQIAYLA